MAKDIRECLLEQARKFHQWQEITYPGKTTEEIGGAWEVDYPAWNDIFDAFCHVAEVIEERFENWQGQDFDGDTLEPSEVAQAIMEYLDCECTYFPSMADDDPIMSAYSYAQRLGVREGFVPVLIQADDETLLECLVMNADPEHDADFYEFDLKTVTEYRKKMKIVQHFAMLNRQAMMDEIVKGMKLHVEEQFTTIHNYIDTDAMILRKGAVSAKAGEQLLIPINMRDGSLLCVGKGNEDWNCSAPHGAGRLMSRADAKQSFTVSEFKKQMAEVYTTSVSKATLDECPMAYKGMQDILDNIGPTADVVKVIRPIYNFKAGDEE